MWTTRTTTAPTTIALVATVAVVMALLPVIVPPAWAQAPEGDPVERVGGSDRVGTAVAVTQSGDEAPRSMASLGTIDLR